MKLPGAATFTVLAALSMVAAQHYSGPNITECGVGQLIARAKSSANGWVALMSARDGTKGELLTTRHDVPMQEHDPTSHGGIMPPRELQNARSAV